ncbi:MAG: cytochrome c maturation protein CcmE [Sphingomonadaceae bacterium]|nr:cytochrome c maturation protein CcmE [Sphingomonadaceae bacterium]
MKPKHQRLALAGAALAALGIAATLALPALKDQAAYFYAPADVAAKGVTPGQAIRLGGLVEKGSLTRSADGLTIHFRVTDRLESVPVAYTGIVPDLFREGQGMIADGRFDADGTFRAETLLAKHDENYMPPEVAKAVEKAEAAAKARPETPTP